MKKMPIAVQYTLYSERGFIMRKFISVLLACSVLLSVSGCAAGNAPSTALDYETNGGASLSDGFDKAEPSATAGALTTAGTAAGDGADVWIGDSAEDFDYDAAADFAYAAEAIGAYEGGAYEEYSSPEAEQLVAGQLTAGEWNDNENWNAWVSLYQSHEDWENYREEWDIDFDIRCEVTVTAFGAPIEGAIVSQNHCDTSGMFNAVTDNKGKAYLFLKACEDDEQHYLDIYYNDVHTTIKNVDLKASGEYTVDLTDLISQHEVIDYNTLELMLVIDTTGSMADELEYIQTELEDVVKRVKSDNANIPIRISVNFYRDEGDEYVVRDFDFTEDIDEVTAALMAQYADGGGDTPEAVHTALGNAINDHEWSKNTTKLMFLVLDAPPHSDSQIIDSVNHYVNAAANDGIRIIPVASSGVDKSTEYLLRTMAFRTGGTYTFLTNHSGIGGDHIEPTIGDYEVEKLNDLMVRVISEYIA